MKIESIGTLRYSPKLNGSLNRRGGGSTKWWLVLDADPELGRYLLHLYRLFTYRTQNVQKPVWAAHISIIRDEEPDFAYKSLWNKYNGQSMPFEYDLTRTGGDDTYIWLPVTCEKALDIRQELGLPRNPYFPLHLTFANRKPQQ